MNYKKMFFITMILCLFVSLFSGCNCNEHEHEHMLEPTNTTIEEAPDETVMETKPIETTEPQTTEKKEDTVITDNDMVNTIPDKPIKPKPTNPEPTEDNKDENNNMVSLGEFRLTAYCNCSICCGKWAGGATASGTIPAANRTIAVDTDIIPFGTEIIIYGKTYIAEDTGKSIYGNRIDIYFDSHQEASDFGIQYAEIFKIGS